MRRYLNAHTFALWLLIITYLVLLGGHFAGIDWSLSPKLAFGRLLTQPLAASTLALCAIALLLLDQFKLRRKKAVIITLAILSACVALYVMWMYLIGIEYFLLYGASSMIRKYTRESTVSS
ncbi:MAG: hypothetical protein V4582_07105 [Pseudomonadota bacterium]